MVLRDFSNLLLHLDPHPVVARVATSTALLRDPVLGFAHRDVQLARLLGEHGMNVVQPLQGLSAGPHVHDGLVVTLWEFVPGAADTLSDPERFGRELRALHEALAAVPDQMAGPPAPVEDIGRFLDAAERWWPDAPSDLIPMRRTFDAVLARIEGHRLPPQQLHGDAHAGNLLVDGDALVWTDFEDTWYGPVAWDLACVAESGRLDSELVFAAYGDAPDPDVLADFRVLRRLHHTTWLTVFASRFPRYRERAAMRIAEWGESAVWSSASR